MKKQSKIFIILFLLIFSTMAEQVIIATSLPSNEEDERTSESSTIGVGKLDKLLSKDEGTETSPREVSQEELLSPATKIDDETQEISAYSGTGTEQDPFTAGTAADFATVLTTIRNDSGVGPYYIQLTGNIVPRNTISPNLGYYAEIFNLYKDTVIDGQGNYFLLPNEVTLARCFLAVQTDGINVTLKNLNFGSDQLIDENGIDFGFTPTYGIISYGSDSSMSYNLTIENGNFYNTRPNISLLTLKNDSGYVRFKGNNRIIFNAATGTAVLDNPNVIFEADSYTYIETGEGLYVFFGSRNASYPEVGAGNLNVQIKSNAKLEIVTSKQGLAYGQQSATMTVEEGAELSVRGDYNGNMQIISVNYLAGVNGTLNIDKDAKVDLVNQSNFRIPNLTINVDQPEYFRLESLDNTLPFANSNSIINRLDGISGETGGYQLSYLDPLGQLITREVPGGSAVSANPSINQSNGKGFLYQRKFTIDESEPVPEVGIGISRLTTSINTVEPIERPITKYQLKLSTRQLWTSSTVNRSVNTVNSQQAISNATSTTNGVLAIESSATESSWQKEKLPAGTYYVYIRVTGMMQEEPELQKYLSESLWYEFVVEVPKSPISVDVPLEKFFRVREIGEFDETANALPIISYSNFPIDFKVIDVVEESTDSPISLVNSHVPGVEKHLQLYLAATNGQHTGPLVVGSNDGNTIEVLPFLEDPLKLYLRGHYSGPIDGRHDVRYKFTYQLTPR